MSKNKTKSERKMARLSDIIDKQLTIINGKQTPYILIIPPSHDHKGSNLTNIGHEEDRFHVVSKFFEHLNQRRNKAKADAVRVVEPIHPGRVLLEQFLQPQGIYCSAEHKVMFEIVCDELGLAPAVLDDIILGMQPVTEDIAKKFSDYYGNSVEFWMDLQTKYDEDCNKLIKS